MTKNEMNRLIAEKCEGLEAIDDQLVKHRDRGGEHGCNDRVRIDDYFTDIAACVRAAEAWRKQDSHIRAWGLSIDETEDGGSDSAWTRFLTDDDERWDRTSGSGTPAAALAAALVEAVK